MNATVLGMASNQNTPLEISWADSGGNSGRRIAIDGPVPVIGRSIRLDLAGHPKGEYEVASCSDCKVEREGTGKAGKRVLLTIY